MQTLEKMEPMSTGQILDRTLKLYSRNWSLLLGISAVLTLPVVGIMIALNYYTQYALQTENGSGLMIGGLLNLVVICIYGFVTYPLAQGASTFAISERYLNKEVGVGQAIGFGWRRLGTLFNVSVSIGLRVFLGMLLLIVPGIVWACTYIAAIPAVMIEGCKARDGMSRSRELSLGRRKSVFGILVAIWALSFVIDLSFYFAIDLSLGAKTFIGGLLYTVASQGVVVLLMPVGVIAATLLYYDFRIRKEGFDLEMLQQAMSADFAEAANEGSDPMNKNQEF